MFDFDFERIEQDRIENYEEQLVKKLFAFAGLPFNKRKLREDAGQATVPLEHFNYLFPSFPVRLGAAKLRYTHTIGVGDLFGSKFTNTSFFNEYKKLFATFDANPVDNQVGLIFNWAGIGDGGYAMVLHNRHIDIEHNTDISRGTRIVRPFGNPVVVYTIESLNDFLATIGKDWAQYAADDF